MTSDFKETIVAGGKEGEFCTFRHLMVRGTQEAIGAALADTAARNHGVAPQAGGDPVEISLHLADTATGERRTPYFTFGLAPGAAARGAVPA